MSTIRTSATTALFSHITGTSKQALGMARLVRLALASLIGCSAIATVPVAAQSGRVIYVLNCLGCHPVPEGVGVMSSSTRPTGEFVQLAQGRQFFMRLPPADGHPLPAEEDARLVTEILNWRSSCTVILQSSPVVGLRPTGKEPVTKQGTYAR